MTAIETLSRTDTEHDVCPSASVLLAERLARDHALGDCLVVAEAVVTLAQR